MYATGEYPLAQIRKIINSLGLVGKKGKMLSVSNYQYMLKNKIYYGVIEYNGELCERKHEPIIAKKLFDETQEVIKRKSKPQKMDKMKFFLYRGFFHCGECGFTITADKKIKPSGKSYTYYYCTKKNTMPRRFAPSQHLLNSLNVKLGGVFWLKSEPFLTKIRTANFDAPPRRRSLTLAPTKKSFLHNF